MKLFYCLKCRKNTETVNEINSIAKNGRNYTTGKCTICGQTKTQFISSSKAGGDIQKSLNNLPGFPWAKYPFEKHLIKF
jgi:hypothetical protein